MRCATLLYKMIMPILIFSLLFTANLLAYEEDSINSPADNVDEKVYSNDQKPLQDGPQYQYYEETNNQKRN